MKSKKNNNKNMFKLKELPYGLEDLNPLFTKEQLEVHYTKHHQTYCDNFNKAVADLGIEGKSILEILGEASKYNQAIINHGGGFWNHEFFWESLSPEKKEISEKLKNKIEESFGSVEIFKDTFLTAAKTLFGSGWAWLILNKESGKLEIIQTQNQDSPVMDFVKKRIGENTPLLNLDVWEHAYYVDYKNVRPEYVEKIWDFIDWEKVEERLI